MKNLSHLLCCVHFVLFLLVLAVTTHCDEVVFLFSFSFFLTLTYCRRRCSLCVHQTTIGGALSLFEASLFAVWSSVEHRVYLAALSTLNLGGHMNVQFFLQPVKHPKLQEDIISSRKVFKGSRLKSYLDQADCWGGPQGWVWCTKIYLKKTIRLP